MGPPSLALVATLLTLAPRPASGEEDYFRATVAPILARHCVGCHGGAIPKGGLDLSSAEGVRLGGEGGPVLVSGKPDQSALLDRVLGPEPDMPKDSQPLSLAEQAILRNWIERGGHWPKDVVLRSTKGAEEKWWSLEPLRRPTVPAVGQGPWPRGPIDAFLLEGLDQENLSPSAQADRRTLLRRLSFDLLGLPPDPAAVQTAESDPHPLWYEKIVDRLLASPAYGERWARHWLDVAHYGDTHGFDKDKRRDHAWPYRDYVIRALNADVPYGRFLEEQLAGDYWFPEWADGPAATGFVAAGPWDFVGHVELAEGTENKLITRNLDRDDMVTSALSTFASLTVHCARCHDHPFDPIRQEEYYRLQAVFAGVERDNVPREPAKLRALRAAIDRRRARLEADKKAAERSKDDARRERIDKDLAALAREAEQLPTPALVYSIRSIEPREIHVLHRGDVRRPLRSVAPGALACVRPLGAELSVSLGAPEAERRAALARWLADPAHPLTWRSIVNRVWHYHFGRGIVDTPSDFGRMGSTPTHPELLDYLAMRFLDEGQSLKRLHRSIVTSAAYRQASTHDEAKSAIDSGNRFLWRSPRRRLDAESLRDAALSVAGNLSSTMGGPGFDLFAFVDDHSPHYLYEKADVDDPRTFRRTIYRFVVRSAPDPMMECLDGADPSAAVPAREETVTPLQALALLHSPFFLRQAERFAERLARSSADPGEQIERGFLLALARRPTAEEKTMLADFAKRRGLAAATRLLLNSSEFLYVD